MVAQETTAIGVSFELLAYSGLAGLIGSAIFYLSLNAETTFTQRIKTMVVSIIIGAVAYVLSHHYYPSKDAMINWAIYPIAAGFSVPWLLKGYAAMLYAFSQNPLKTVNEIAAAYAKFKNNSSKKQTNEDQKND